MLLVAAASRKLADAELSILIEWRPVTLPTSNGPTLRSRGFHQWATDWCGIMRRDFPE